MFYMMNMATGSVGGGIPAPWPLPVLKAVPSSYLLRGEKKRIYKSPADKH